MRLLLFGLSLLYLASCQSQPSIIDTPCPVIGDCLEEEVIYSPYPVHPVLQESFKPPALIGGKPADPADWPASVYAAADNSSCSATVVGDRVVLIAAHCVAASPDIAFSAGSNQYKATCDVHPSGKINTTADWALCMTDRPVTGVLFEGLLSAENKISVGTSLLLTGYGCIRPGGGGGNDGIFRVGKANILSTPSKLNNHIVTEGGAALCFGDSGGSAYLVLSPNERYIVGVNSAGDISTVSYISATTAKLFTDWAHKWAIDKKARICGLHADAKGCRIGGAQPEPGTRFEILTQAACVKGAVRAGFVSQQQEIVESVRKALESFKEMKP